MIISIGREDFLERDSILTGLSTLSFHEKQKDTLSKHREGTGQWVLYSDEFQQWFKGVESSTLWCYGMRTCPFCVNLA